MHVREKYILIAMMIVINEMNAAKLTVTTSPEEPLYGDKTNLTCLIDEFRGIATWKFKYLKNHWHVHCHHNSGCSIEVLDNYSFYSNSSCITIVISSVQNEDSGEYVCRHKKQQKKISLKPKENHISQSEKRIMVANATSRMKQRMLAIIMICTISKYVS